MAGGKAAWVSILPGLELSNHQTALIKYTKHCFLNLSNKVRILQPTHSLFKVKDVMGNHTHTVMLNTVSLH